MSPKMICQYEHCTGCSACFNICPQNCIAMTHDQSGSLVPKTYHEKCIDCNLCIKVCPANHEGNYNDSLNAYAVWSLDENDHKTSASGGAASVFYQYMVEQLKGIGFGTSFNDKLELNFESVDDKEELHKFKGSKYVQANVGDSYKKIKDLLKINRNVLFIGTPCQIDGLNHYLGRKYDNLVTVDLVCHGVPSIKYLQEHVQYIENKLNQKVDNISFRGTNDYDLTLYNNGNIIYKKNRWEDLYFQGFLNGLFYRESCYTCKYASPKRISDITIGDFWGLGDDIPFNHEKKGRVSLVLINTNKGKEYFDNCKSKLFYEQRSIEEAIKGNSQLNHPPLKLKNYTKFKEYYIVDGFQVAANKYLKRKIRNHIMKSKLKTIIKRIAKVQKS